MTPSWTIALRRFHRLLSSPFVPEIVSATIFNAIKEEKGGTLAKNSTPTIWFAHFFITITCVFCFLNRSLEFTYGTFFIVWQKVQFDSHFHIIPTSYSTCPCLTSFFIDSISLQSSCLLLRTVEVLVGRRSLFLFITILDFILDIHIRFPEPQAICLLLNFTYRYLTSQD